MAKIECTAGYAETPVGGVLYVFERDRYGRFVAEVHKDEHVDVLLSVVHYRRVDEDGAVSHTALTAGGEDEATAPAAPDQPEPAPAPTKTEPADSDGGSASTPPTSPPPRPARP